MSCVFLNGEFIAAAEAKISVFDQGLLYGDGIYESFRSVGEQLYQFDQHFARLQLSAQALDYKLPYSRRGFEDILHRLRTRNGLNNAYYRITITRGPGGVGFLHASKGEQTCVIIAHEFEGFAEEHYRKGIKLRVAQTRRNAPEAINPKIKSISNLNSLLGKLEAKASGAFEVIMLNNRGEVCEGAASNIFWSKGGQIYTPSPATGLLEGVTRATIMRLCETELKRPPVSGEYLLQELLAADEVFLTSTSLEVMPVIQIDDFTLHQGQVGAVARDLRAALHRDMAQALTSKGKT